MRIPVQKAITNPLKILGAPYGLAMVNFIVFFIIFVLSIIVFEGDIQPVYFLIPFVLAHYILARMGNLEPQLGRIVSARLKLITIKVPKNLIS
jgi:type IV secretory pathway TrbD component